MSDGASPLTAALVLEGVRAMDAGEREELRALLGVGVVEPVAASPWLDVRGAAEYLACSPDRMYDLVQLRKLRPRRDGRRLLLRRSDLDAYLECAA